MQVCGAWGMGGWGVGYGFVGKGMGCRCVCKAWGVGMRRGMGRCQWARQGVHVCG